MLGEPPPIERDDEILRTRKTAAVARILLGAVGIGLLLLDSSLLNNSALGIAGFAVVIVSSLVQSAAPGGRWLRVEESVAGIAAILIIGLGDQHVTIVNVLWLVALATGVMARGGRVHWIGRVVVLAALALPIAREGQLSADYAAFCLAVVGLQLTSGRLTMELNRLLRQARLEADSAGTLLRAGDIAARVSHESVPVANSQDLDPKEARQLLEEVIEAGVPMAVQPIVDLSTAKTHGYEALARIDPREGLRGPLEWFALADRIGMRSELERACLRSALDLLGVRPSGTVLTVNLSAGTLIEPETEDVLRAGALSHADLSGLIIEITEETLASNQPGFAVSVEKVRASGARLAVDDIGAGYSGLHQITAVLPEYLKLDRKLVRDIDQDPDRAALVDALTGYATQVGSLLVAEGIENRGELESVMRMGVPLVQGYFLARPGEPWPNIDPGACADIGTSNDFDRTSESSFLASTMPLRSALSVEGHDRSTSAR